MLANNHLTSLTNDTFAGMDSIFPSVNLSFNDLKAVEADAFLNFASMTSL